jgi:nitrite reductase/ring-hydroxylating ferredoxin subunit
MTSSKPCQCGHAARTRRARRAFLKNTALLVSAAVMGSPWGPRDAAALPVVEGQPDVVAGEELTYAIPAADGAVVDREHGVIVARYLDHVMAFNLSCPHENAAIRWKPALGRFECSRHDSAYSPAGVYTSGRATRNLDRFAVRTQGTSIVVDVSRLIQSDLQRPAWELATLDLRTSGGQPA